MKYRDLGRTGIKVSPYALGALMFASVVGNPDPEDSIRIIHKALDAGINLVDTADSYGDSEEVVGRALKGRRDHVVLTTKVSRPMGPDPNQQGASRRWIIAAVENSLRRLQTDHIDVYQIRGRDTDVTRARFHTAFRDERRLDTVERLIPLAEQAGLSMPHLAMAFAISHPGVTSALLGPRTMEQLDDLLAGVDVVLSDDILDRIDEIVPPGTDIGTLDQAYVPPSIQKTELRRRPLGERSAA
jgi:aryl-alcohol dehydrogenase-like predicted oxidoreductase